MARESCVERESRCGARPPQVRRLVAVRLIVTSRCASQSVTARAQVQSATADRAATGNAVSQPGAERAASASGCAAPARLSAPAAGCVRGTCNSFPGRCCRRTNEVITELDFDGGFCSAFFSGCLDGGPFRQFLRSASVIRTVPRTFAIRFRL